MAFRMARMARVRSGAFKARKGIPADVRDEYAALYGKRWEELFRAPPYCSPQQAKALRNEWEAEIDTRFATLRAKQRGEGHDLTPKQAHALAGVWYRWFTTSHEDSPGSPDRWDSLCEALEGLTPYDPETGRIDWEAVREEVHPGLADEAKTAQFLATKGEALTHAARTLFLNAVFIEFRQAAVLLGRRADGDYSPDGHLQELGRPQDTVGSPLIRSADMAATGVASKPDPAQRVLNGRVRPTAGLGPVALFEAYRAASPRKVSTVNRWASVFSGLGEAMEVEGAAWDAQRWLDSLVGTGTPPRGHRTVRDIWLAAPRAVYGWAVRKRLIESNPFDGCVVEVPRPIVTRETGRGFTDEEAATILRTALGVTSVPIGRKGCQWAACRRWVPWLAAYTGARGGELTQLRAKDIETRACGPVLRITPEAGTVKTDKVRIVPIHEHLVEQGFLDFVEAARDQHGPNASLFHLPSKADSPEGYRGPAVKARERLAAWVREQGVTDKGISPLHGWRHTFKAKARRAGIEAGVRDAIVGHSPRTVAEIYEHVPVEDMAEAMKLFPRYVTSGECP